MPERDRVVESESGALLGPPPDEEELVEEADEEPELYSDYGRTSDALKEP